MIRSLLLKNIKVTLFTAVLLFTSNVLVAQTSYNIDDINGLQVDVETGSTVYFYDDGGKDNNYSRNKDYTTAFKSKNEQPLLITFTNFRTQNNNNYLQVFDGPNTSSPLLRTISGNQNTANITIFPTSDAVTFRFHSNNNNTQLGWAATITSMDMSAADITTCSGTFTDKQGVSNYTKNQYYKQTYRSNDVTKDLLFTFTDFNLGNNDKLIVLDGDNADATKIGEYSGNGSPGTVISTNKALTFVFMANDDNSVGRGWSANISCFAVKTFYSYNNANWNQPGAWTLDPSGNNHSNPGNEYPTQFDKAVILNGKTITVSNNNNKVTQLEIRDGGVLDVGATTGNDFGTVIGKGRLRSRNVNLPVGVYTLFTQAGGGTIELYGAITGSNLSEETFNNLEINANSGQTVQIEKNTQINGNLLVKGGTLNINSATNTSITVEGDITVNSGTIFGMGAANSNARALYVKGDFENDGTVTFTNSTTAGYTNDPIRSVDLYFNNANKNQSFAVNGQTTLNKLIVDKGTDDTYMLDVNANNTANFRLFGRNNQDASNTENPGNVINNKALEVYAGTLRLGSNITIPRLLTGNGSVYYTIDQDATIILDGSNVVVTGQDNTTSIIIYGKLKVMGNSTFRSTGAQGIILREYGILEIEGNSTVTTKSFRTSSRLELGTHRGTFLMSGGTMNIEGSDFPTSHPSFTLPFPDNTLQISGGTINIEYGTTGRNESWLVSSNPENISITGGTVNIYANNRNPRINSTAPFYNLNLISNSGNNTISIEPISEQKDGVNITVPQADRRPLIVLNNLTVGANTTFNPQSEDVTVGKNFILTGAYTPGSNTTTFNAFGIQSFTNSGNITGGGLYDMALTNGSILTISNLLNVRNNLTINSQTTLRDGGNTINIAGNILNSGKHESATGGSLILNGTAAQAIDGNGFGEFGNLSLNKATGTTTTKAHFKINGNLRLGSTAAVLNIGSNKLTLGTGSRIYNALTGTASGRSDFTTSRMVQTSGAQSDLGIVKLWNAIGTFTYPLGTNGKYTPAVINVDEAPTTWGELSVNPVNGIHPLATNPNSLKHYWNVRRTEMLGIPSGSLRLNFYFDDVDIVGDENTYIPAYYFPVNWTFFNDPNLVTNLTNEILFQDVPNPRGHFTAGQPAAFGTVKTYYSNVTEGSWDLLPSWSYDAAGTQTVTELPGENSPVIIQSGHKINIPTNNKLVGSLIIEENAVLDVGTTTGHFFGLVHESTVSGTGTLRITSSKVTAEFPGGDFGDFLGNGGGTVEYYTTGTQNYTMPKGDITTVEILNEGFEGGFHPAGWVSRSGPNDANGWPDPNTDWERSTVTAHSGSASARHIPPNPVSYIFGTYWGEQDDILVTPALDFSDGDSYQLSFWRYNSTAEYRYQGVWVSTTNSNYNSFVDIEVLGAGTDSWVQHTVDLSQFAGEGTVYIAFAYKSWGNRNTDHVYIDDVKITKTIGTSRYHNLVINPSAGRTITLPGINVTTTGKTTIKGSGTAATSASFPATLTVTDSLTIKENATLRIDNARPFMLEQNGPAVIGENATLSVNTAGTTAEQHQLTFYGNVENNGTINLNPGSNKHADIYFMGTANQTFAGTGTTASLNQVYVDKGTSQTPLVNVTASKFDLNTALGQALYINNGTIRFSGTSLNLTLTKNSSFNIPATGCLSINGSTVTIGSAADNNADLLLTGKLDVRGGTMNIGAAGNNTHNDIEYAAAGAPEVSVLGGTLNVNGQIRRSTTIATGNLTYRQSGGDVFIYGKNRDADQIKRALLEVLNDGRFISTDGNLHLVQGVASGEGRNTFGELYLSPASSTVTGGTIITGTSATAAATNEFNLYLNCPIYNLTVDGTTTAKNARLRTFEATLKGSLIIEGPEESVFYTNRINLSIAGDLISRSGHKFGSFSRGNDTHTTTFNGVNQTVYKDDIHISGGGLSFGNVVVNQQNGGTLTLENWEFWVRGDLSLLKGKIIQKNSNNIYAMNNVYLQNNVAFSSEGTGKLNFFNTSQNQHIYTDNTGSLGNVYIRYNNGVILEGDLTINGRLDFPSDGKSGTLKIGKNRLTFASTASVGQSSVAPGSGRFIITNGALADKGVTKVFSSAGESFTFPIGVEGKYTPATMNVTNTGGTAGTITVKPIDAPHPSCSNTLIDELQYFWNVTSTGFSNPTVSHSYTYVDGDIEGTENNYVNARFYDYTWANKQTEALDISNNRILFSNANFIDGEYTAGDVENFGTVYKYYSAGNGAWDTPSSWRLNSQTGPPADVMPKGNPVFILSPHTITNTLNGAYAGSVDIETGARLNVGTTIEHNIGHVTGGGTIAVTSQSAGSFIFPGGEYEGFMSTEGSTVEYTGAGTLPANITTYQNVTFMGNNTRTIPAIEMLVLGNLLIENGTLSSAIFNRPIKIEGNWIDNVSGGFNPGTGSVIFQGSKEQTITTGGAAETYYNLQINKAVGSTLTLDNAAWVNRILTLSSGIVNTTSTNLLTVDYAVTNAISGGNTNAYINGPLRRMVNNNSNAIFPVGKDGRFGNLYIFETTSTGSQYWTGEYFNTQPANNLNLAAPLQLVSTNEYWSLQGVNGSLANVRLRWDDQSAIIPTTALNRQKLRVAQYTPPWSKVGETVNDISQTQGTVQTSNQIAFDGSVQNFTLAIEQTASAQITSSDVMHCNDGSTFAVTYTVAGDAPLRIIMQINGGNDHFYTNLAEGSHTVNFTYAELYAIAGAGDYDVTIAEVYDKDDLNGIILGAGVTLTLLPTPNPIINGPTSVMTNSTTTYSVTAIADNTYSWSVSGLGTIPNTSSNTINVDWGNSTGTATLTLTQSSPGPNSCSTKVTYEVDVRDWPVITGNFSVCANSTEVFETKEVSGHEYIWSVQGGIIQETSPYESQITVVWSSQTAGRVTLTQGPSGNQTTIFQDVTINPSPIANLTVAESDGVCDGAPVTLSFSPATNAIYELMLDEDTYSPFDLKPTPKPNPYTTEPLVWEGTAPGKEYTFRLRVTNTNTGCTSTWVDKTVKVWKIPETGPPYHIPNAFGE